MGYKIKLYLVIQQKYKSYLTNIPYKGSLQMGLISYVVTKIL